jgi:hypothetical protein
VDIPAAHSSRFFQAVSCQTELSTSRAFALTLAAFLHRLPGLKSIAAVFLNCTKNTELTRSQFNRTVSFAPHKKVLVPDAKSGGHSIQIYQSQLSTNRASA